MNPLDDKRKNKDNIRAFLTPDLLTPNLLATMLVIRLSRIGKKGQPHFRLIVQEKTLSPKKKAVEILGNYAPAHTPKMIELKDERIKHWIKMGAQPSDTVAALLKKKGFANMDQYLAPRNKQRKSTKDTGKEEAPEKSKAPEVEKEAIPA